MSEKLNPEDVKARTLKVIRKSLLIELPEKNVDLVESGLIDSLSLIEFIVALETEFDIVIAFDNLDLDNFRTIEGITAQIINKGP